MKRVLGTLMLVSALLMAQPSQAQSLSFGVKGGLNNTKMAFNETVFDEENRFGWFIGPSAKISILGGLGVDIAALYDQKESKIDDETIKQKSILIPVNARLNVGLGSAAGIYVAAGPQFGFNVGDDEFDLKGIKEYANNKFQLKKSTFSVNLGAGVYLSKHLEVGFAYNIPMGDTADASFKNAVDGIKADLDDNGAKAKTWTISAAYYF